MTKSKILLLGPLLGLLIGAATQGCSSNGGAGTASGGTGGTTTSGGTGGTTGDGGAGSIASGGAGGGGGAPVTVLKVTIVGSGS